MIKTNPLTMPPYLGICLMFVVLTTGIQSAEGQESPEWLRYYPMAVGNVWQYSVTNTILSTFDYHVFNVARDTSINGDRYFIVNRESFDERKVFKSKATCAVFPEGGPWWQDLTGQCQPTGCFPVYGLGLDHFINGLPGEAEIGGYDYEFELLSSPSSGGCGPGGRGCMALYLKAASDLGLYSCISTRFGTSYPAVDTVETAILDYAKIDGREYGTPVVSTGIIPQTGAGRSFKGPFPNPFSTEFVLEIEEVQGSVLHVEIIDALGRFVNTETLIVPRQGSLRHTVDGADWPRGVYLIRIRDAYGAMVTKVVVRV